MPIIRNVSSYGSMRRQGLMYATVPSVPVTDSDKKVLEKKLEQALQLSAVQSMQIAKKSSQQLKGKNTPLDNGLHSKKSKMMF